MAAMGPFYCPADKKIYLDTSFFQMIETRFRGCDAGSPSCRFAQAYVIAHEVGASRAERARHSRQRAAAQQQRLRRQDAGGQPHPGARRAAGRLPRRHLGQPQRRSGSQPGDIEAALRTASAIGDDTLQRARRAAWCPNSFTHGTSEQRQRWFNTGFKQGTVDSCNTFSPTAQL